MSLPFFKSVRHFLTSFHCYYYYSTVTILRLFYFFMECLGSQSLSFYHFSAPRYKGQMRCDDDDTTLPPRSSYWTQQLFDFEANDSQRFVWLKFIRSILKLTYYHLHMCTSVNLLHANISKHILHTTLRTYPMMLTRRICLIIKSFFSQ